MSLEFEDIGSSRKSHVWQHFLFNRSREKGKCKDFSTVLKMSGSRTKTLMNHLKSNLAMKLRPQASQRHHELIPKTEKESRSEVIAQLVPKDGFSFS